MKSPLPSLWHARDLTRWMALDTVIYGDRFENGCAQRTGGGQAQSLRQRILHSAGWIFGFTGISYGLRFISNLVLAQFLLPEAFGVMAIAIILQIAAEQLGDIGIAQSIIRERHGATRRFLQVAWTAQLIRSGIVAGVILVLASAVAMFGPHFGGAYGVYGQSELPVLVAFMAISTLLTGATSTNISLARRRLDYRLITLIDLSAQIFAFAAMLVFVWISPTVWALLCGALVFACARMIASHLFLPGPSMRVRYDKRIFLRLWAFGRWIMLSSLLNFIAQRADSLILGGLVSAAVFGVYTVASLLMEALLGLIRQMNNQLGFPGLSEVIRERPQEIGTAFSRYIAASNLVLVSSAALCMVCAPALIEYAYPSAFEEAAHYIQIMAPALLLMRFAVHTELLLSQGNSRAVAINALIKACGVCVFVPVGYVIGEIEGAIAAAVIAKALAAPYVIQCSRDVLSAEQMVSDYLWLSVSVATVFAMTVFN